MLLHKGGTDTRLPFRQSQHQLIQLPRKAGQVTPHRLTNHHHGILFHRHPLTAQIGRDKSRELAIIQFFGLKQDSCLLYIRRQLFPFIQNAMFMAKNQYRRGLRMLQVKGKTLFSG